MTTDLFIYLDLCVCVYTVCFKESAFEPVVDSKTSVHLTILCIAIITHSYILLFMFVLRKNLLNHNEVFSHMISALCVLCLHWTCIKIRALEISFLLPQQSLNTKQPIQTHNTIQLN